MMKKVLVFVLIIAAALASWFLFLQDHLPSFMEWVREQGLWGAVLVGLGYAVATVLMIPGSLVTLLIGAIYGPWLGTALVSPASVLGATLAFLLGRTVFRPSMEAKMANSPRFTALQGAMEQQGFKILTLVRLSPIFPFTLVNYAFGLTRVSLGAYILGSFLGMLPGTLMYVYLGSAVGDVASLARWSGGNRHRLAGASSEMGRVGGYAHRDHLHHSGGQKGSLGSGARSGARRGISHGVTRSRSARPNFARPRRAAGLAES